MQCLTLITTQRVGTVVRSQAIADRLGVSATAVTKALQPLGRRGLLRSTRGRTGGWMLVSDPHTITLAEVLDVLEPEAEWERCVFGNEECPGEVPCPFHEEWRKAREQLRSVMARTTLDQLPSFPLPTVPDVGESDRNR